MQKPSLYHIITTPETINSLIQNGTFPNNLDDYVFPQQIVLHDAFSAELPPSHTNPNQSFIVEVKLTQAHHPSNFIPSDISRIFVYSDTGKSLLQKLLQTKFTKPIIIDPTLFNAWKKSEDPQKKRIISDTTIPDTYVALEKKLKADSIDTQFTLLETSPSSGIPRKRLTRLGSTDEHIAELTNAFLYATEKILITSNSLDSDTFEKMDLYNLICVARARGVEINIYCCDSQDVELNILQFLAENAVNIESTKSNSKILAVDDSLIAIGSYNWLSGIAARNSDVCEGTIVFNDPICAELLVEICNHIKHYQNNINSLYYHLSEACFLKYIPTADQHRTHCTQAFQIARQNIIICTPYISSNFTLDIDLNLISRLAHDKVEMYFICREDDRNLTVFSKYINEVSSPYIHILTSKNFHLKTIIVDDESISEGSFNWFSAGPHDPQKPHHHEATFEVSGIIAKNMIEHFYASPIGRLIIDHILQMSSRSSSSQDSFLDVRKAY